MPADKSGENTPLGPYFRDANGSVHPAPDISPLGEHIADATNAVGMYPSNIDGKPAQLFTGTRDKLSYHPATQPISPEIRTILAEEITTVEIDTVTNPNYGASHPGVVASIAGHEDRDTEWPAENFTPHNPEKIRQWALIDARASLAFTEFNTAQYPLSAALRDLENTERAIVETIIMQLNDNAVRHRVQDALGLENGNEITERLTDIDDDATIYNTGYSLLTAVLENGQAFNIEPLEQQISSQGTLAEQHQQLMTLISPLLLDVAEMVAGEKDWPENISVEGQNNISAIVTYLQDLYRESPQATIKEVLYDMEFTHDDDLNRLEDAFPDLVISIRTQRSLANVVVDALTNEGVEQVLREHGDLLGVSELSRDTVYLSANDANRALLSFRLSEPKKGRNDLLNELRAEVVAAKDKPFHPMYLKSEVLGSISRDLVRRAIYDSKYGTSDIVEGLAKILDIDTTSLDLDALRDQTEQYLTTLRDEDITDSDVFYSVVNTIISSAEALGITLDTSYTISNNTTVTQQLRQLALELRPLFGRVSDIITSTNPQWPNGTTQETILSAIQEMTDSLSEQEPGLEIKPAQVLWRVYNALKPQNPSLIDYLQAHDASFVNEELTNLSTSFGLTFENNTAADTLTEATQGEQTSAETSSSLIDLHSAKLEDLETTLAILRSYNDKPTIQNADAWTLAETINPDRVSEHSDDSIHATAYVNKARALVEKELRQKRLEQAIDGADGEKRLEQKTNAIITTLQLNQNSRNNRRLGQALAIWATLENMSVNSPLEVEQLIERASQTTTAILDGNDFEDMRFLAEALYVREGYAMPQSWRDSASNSRARVRQTLQQGILNLKRDVAEVLKRPSTQIQEPSNLNSFQNVTERSAYLKQQGYTITAIPTQDEGVSQIIARKEDDDNIKVHSFYTTEPGADNVEPERGRQETSRPQPSVEILPSSRADEVGQRRRPSFGDRFTGPDVTTTW